MSQAKLTTRLGSVCSLQYLSAAASKVPDEDPAQTLATLRAKLIDPLGLAKGTRRLLISPDGALGFTPFSALVPGLDPPKEILDLDASQCDMRRVGTAHLVEIMDEYDLLPTCNYRFGRHPDTPNIDSSVWRSRFSQKMPDGCWLGCTMSCAHAVDDFPLRTGPYAGEKVLVDGPEYETGTMLGANLMISDHAGMMKAIEIYRRLLEQQPERSDLKDKVLRIESKQKYEDENRLAAKFSEWIDLLMNHKKLDTLKKLRGIRSTDL